MVDSKKVKAIRAKAHANENNSGCSQAVVSALQEGLGVGDLQSLKAATAFAGGVARRGESCGALIGALMVLGLEEGREKLEDTPVLNATVVDGIALSNEFMRRLEKEFNLKKPLKSTLCWELQEAIFGKHWNLTDPVQRNDFITSGGHGDNGCLKVCGIAAEVASEIILKKREA